MDKPEHAWMVRAGNENELMPDVRDYNAVAIGWPALGDVSDLEDRKDFKKRFQKAYKDWDKWHIAQSAAQVYKFVRVIQQGDYVVTFDKSSREYWVGQVTSDFQREVDLFGDSYPYIREVEWLTSISRDNLTTSARNSFGSSLTVFSLDDYLDEIHGFVSGDQPDKELIEEEEEETPAFFEETEAKADELISDMISNMPPYDFQDLVAEVLRAMGFEAESSDRGPDRGVDVLAHPDSFGFEEPVIKVQVKQSQEAVGGQGVRQFIGTLNPDENGIYVSTGGFKGDAESYARETNNRVKLINRDDFIDLLIEHYDELDPEFKSKLPLKKIWVPVDSR